MLLKNNAVNRLTRQVNFESELGKPDLNLDLDIPACILISVLSDFEIEKS
jgi:hypothetical protein